MDSLLDPDSLRGRVDVTYREDRSVDDGDDFEYFDAVAGLVAVGVRNGSGEVLLMDGPHGWRLPYGPVESGADWMDVARRYGAATTGTDVTVETVERVTRIDRRLDGSDRATTSHDVVVSTAPVTGRPVDATPAFGPWDDASVAWFGEVPTDAYHEHGDAVDDVRRCLGRDVE